MRLRTKSILLLLLLATCALGTLKWLPKPLPYPSIDPIATPSWSGVLVEGMEIKIADDGTGDLLLRLPSGPSSIQPGHKTVELPLYRFAVSTGKLYEIAPETWNDTRSLLALCSFQSSLLGPGSFTHTVDNKLEYLGTRVDTAFPTVLSTRVDPGKNLASVLSTEGKYQRGFFFLTNSTASGRRAHQVFRMEGARTVGEPVLLGKTTDLDDMRSCWSPDSRYVVYLNAAHTKIWVIGTS